MFGACADYLTDQRSGFRREFQDLLDHAFIDHRQTSRDHPQIDGSNMQERTSKDLPHWEQKGLGPRPTLHCHGL